ncbi:TPA_asm: hypothetical protein GJF44_23175 [Salmonella enterica subsp. enterica serovar Enteritidis]|uniref:Uncharacterized protein n=1 Tax=Salmonella enteritidis TaxID=149539 RepID=A0A6X9V2J3_SALEN|nr:hypothetical protein [Salmonella enterica subsp. enterica serovar Enteritidis]
MKKFLISYNWQGDLVGGFGNCIATPDNGDKFTFTEIRELEKEASKNSGGKAIIISITEIEPE